jgi:hypothetical protein
MLQLVDLALAILKGNQPMKVNAVSIQTIDFDAWPYSFVPIKKNTAGQVGIPQRMWKYCVSHSVNALQLHSNQAIIQRPSDLRVFGNRLVWEV